MPELIIYMNNNENKGGRKDNKSKLIPFLVYINIHAYTHTHTHKDECCFITLIKRGFFIYIKYSLINHLIIIITITISKYTMYVWNKGGGMLFLPSFRVSYVLFSFSDVSMINILIEITSMINTFSSLSNSLPLSPSLSLSLSTSL
jgi:hypothetical protein